ncbi:MULTISPECIES: c-type cytochrome [Marinobacter]|uniref:Cytochrome c n=1 Tax=Marinobacter xiaoshiensis TaxID=3073652 RepID=A0ABU2HD48_9GAMM|nr:MULTISPECIES: cytochrome c [unclassified Marinobacter]MBK1887427.1 cytochrome c [Marinobacter sp. DY40_1A1]MDS1309010.1 cytochrome c [Marinobacter sp. F60267]
MKTVLRKHALTGIILGTFALPAIAADAEAITKKITTCVACHGVDGQSTAPIYPNLAGQAPAYLEMALKAYRAGERNGGMSAVMTPQARNLTDEDIADMAAYYSKQ